MAFIFPEKSSEKLFTLLHMLTHTFALSLKFCIIILFVFHLSELIMMLDLLCTYKTIRENPKLAN